MKAGKRTLRAIAGMSFLAAACSGASGGGKDPPDVDCVEGATYQAQGMVGTTSFDVASDFGDGDLQNADPEFDEPGYLDVDIFPAAGPSVHVRLEFDAFLPINGGNVAARGYVSDTAGGIAGNCPTGELTSRVWHLDLSDESGAAEYRWELGDLRAPPDYCTGGALAGSLVGCWFQPDGG